MSQRFNNYSVVLQDVTKKFDDQIILKKLNLELEKGKFYTLLGPSGCGKTTLLNLIAGFTEVSSGDIYMKGQRVNEIPANKRKVNTVFQDYSLFPHMNVFDNIAFGLKVKGYSRADINEKTGQALRMVRLEGFERRRIQEMSGGQRQRVAIARAIVNEPDVLLLDESLSALDMKLRKEMQVELRQLQEDLGITFVFVTHDQEEALALSDWIFVMSEGEIVQSGPPTDIYDEPVNEYVARFIGESNIVEGRMKGDYLVEFNGQDFSCEDAGIPKNEPVQIVIRPEDIKIRRNRGQIPAHVDQVLFRGVFNEIIAVDDKNFSWKIHSTKAYQEGEDISLYLKPYDLHVMRFNESEEEFDARLDQYSKEGLS